MPRFTFSCMKLVIFLLYNNIFICQVHCTCIYPRCSLYSFLLPRLCRDPEFPWNCHDKRDDRRCKYISIFHEILLYNNIFICQVHCTCIYPRCSLYSFLLPRLCRDPEFPWNCHDKRDDRRCEYISIFHERYSAKRDLKLSWKHPADYIFQSNIDFVKQNSLVSYYGYLISKQNISLVIHGPIWIFNQKSFP